MGYLKPYAKHLFPIFLISLSFCFAACSVTEEKSNTYEYTRAALGSANFLNLSNGGEQIYVVSAGEAAQYAVSQGFTFKLVHSIGDCAKIEFTNSKPWYTGSVKLMAGASSSNEVSSCTYELFSSRELAPGWRFVRLSSYSKGHVLDLDANNNSKWVPHHDFSSVCQQEGKCGSDEDWSWSYLSKPEYGSSSIEIVAKVSAKPGVQGILSLKRLHIMGPKGAEWIQAFE